MRLLTELLTAASTTTGGEGDGGLDLKTALAIPGAAVALVGLLAYLVGIIRPLAVKRSRYWHVGGTTRFSCAVKNRSLLGDRTITHLILVDVPGRRQRIRRPRWKREPQVAELVPWDLPDLPTLGKRDETTLQAELRKHEVSGVYDPGPRVRLLVYAGSRSSRPKRLTKVSG